MKITADLTKGELIANGTKFLVSCNVRTLKDGTRGMAVKEVRRCIPDDLPYDPMPFPKGLWNISAVEWYDEKKNKFDQWEYGSVKIRTDAWQWVNIWDVDDDGNYLKETELKTIDRGYLLHFSESRTTLGCLRIATIKEAEILANFVQKIIDSGETVQIEVI
jgi:hypothetical protein